MASVTKYAGAVTTTSNEGKSWSNPSNAVGVSNGNYAEMSLSYSTRDVRFGLIKGGTIIPVNTDYSNPYWPSTIQNVSCGSPTDLSYWLTDLTPADVNSEDFGFALAAMHKFFTCSGYGDTYTGHLKATNFGFEIPEGSVINAVVAEVRKYQQSGYLNAYVDSIKLTVHYTPPKSGDFLLFF